MKPPSKDGSFITNEKQTNHEKTYHQLKPICSVSYTGFVCHDHGRKLPGKTTQQLVKWLYLFTKYFYLFVQ